MKHRFIHVWQPANDDEIALMKRYYDCGYRLVSHSFYRNEADNNRLIISFIFERECDHNCEQCKKPFQE